MKMRTHLVAQVAIAAIALTIVLPASAHHSHASLNMSDVRMYKGRVTKYSWTMPREYC
jgi:hypothetical protein